MGFFSIGKTFEEAFSRHGARTAVTFYREGRPETTLSYAALNRDAAHMARFLGDHGVYRGSRVILFIPKSLVFVTAYLALHKLGAVVVPLNPGFKKSEMAYFLSDADPALVLAGTRQKEIIQAIDPRLPHVVVDTEQSYDELNIVREASHVYYPAEVGLEDPGLMIYTSGTTGDPKGAVLTQKNLLHDAGKIIRAWEMAASDVLCHALPLFHVHGLGFALHTSLIAGAHILLLDTFHPETVVDLLSNRMEDPVCTVFMGVPAMYARLMEVLDHSRLDFSHMRLWACGSAPLLSDDFRSIKETFGREPVEREGMSETGMNFSNPLKGVKKPGSIGLPLPELAVRIVNTETLKDVAKGETGEIWLKGPGITPGYWKKPEETAAAFHEGWFRTGDLGHVDSDGYFYLTDRIKHIIISGGENISPKEIEAVINRMDGVVESCVVGLPHEKWGEMVAAAVVLESGVHVGREDIKKTCKYLLHDWKCPKAILFMPNLPRNAMGKVLKEEVKKAF